jgi:hypothetical protein
VGVEKRPAAQHYTAGELNDVNEHAPCSSPPFRYLNYYHEVYYELLNSFMGKGDKVGWWGQHPCSTGWHRMASHALQHIICKWAVE